MHSSATHTGLFVSRSRLVTTRMTLLQQRKTETQQPLGDKKTRCAILLKEIILSQEESLCNTTKWLPHKESLCYNKGWLSKPEETLNIEYIPAFFSITAATTKLSGHVAISTQVMYHGWGTIPIVRHTAIFPTRMATVLMFFLLYPGRFWPINDRYNTFWSVLFLRFSFPFWTPCQRSWCKVLSQKHFWRRWRWSWQCGGWTATTADKNRFWSVLINLESWLRWLFFNWKYSSAIILGSESCISLDSDDYK